jgi:hypothetical protein
MALDPDIISLIRDEIGDGFANEQDVVDDDADLPGVPPAFDSLENIYTDVNRGNYSTLGTALIVWRRRLANHRLRAFDVSKEGNWLARSQKTRFLQERVKYFESVTGQGKKAKNNTITSEAETQGLVTTL